MLRLGDLDLGSLQHRAPNLLLGLLGWTWCFFQHRQNLPPKVANETAELTFAIDQFFFIQAAGVLISTLFAPKPFCGTPLEALAARGHHFCRLL